MTNISIISNCNNNCSYCFQKDYHKQNKIMPFDEVKNIIDWFEYKGRVGFLGGEPTLHPDIVKIIKYTISTERVSLIMTNLLGNSSVIEELLQIKKGLAWLINSNYRKELEDLFWYNLENLIKHFSDDNERVSIGSTLTGNFKEDIGYIDKQIAALNKARNINIVSRLGLSTDYHNGNYQIKDFSDSVNYFLDKLEENELDIYTGFDCGINFCNVNPDTIARLLEKDKVEFAVGCKGPAMDILLDGSVTYCFCCPDDFLKVKSYKYFKNSAECSAWLRKTSKLYMEKNGFLCRNLHTNCNNSICPGGCCAQNEYLRRKYNLPLR